MFTGFEIFKIFLSFQITVIIKNQKAKKYLSKYVKDLNEYKFE